MPLRIRRIVDVVSVLGAVSVLAGFAMHHVHERQREEEIRFVAGEVRRFEQTIKLHAATEKTDVNARGWPIWIDPTWFEGSPPRNTLLTPDRPWVEVATPEQSNLQHPPVRVAIHKDTAGFWYNPYQGVVRARVPQEMSDEQTLELYNAVNGADLESIFADLGSGELPIAPVGEAEASASEADEGAVSEQDGTPASEQDEETPEGDPADAEPAEPALRTIPKRPELPPSIKPGRTL